MLLQALVRCLELGLKLRGRLQGGPGIDEAVIGDLMTLSDHIGQ